MLHPSYSDLMNVLNSNAVDSEAPVAKSRYSVVIATAKRAREIIGLRVYAASHEVEVPNDNKEEKALSRAIREINNGRVGIMSAAEDDN
ncbi:MAG: DNA-directed RNA polymerase subunit omega [Lachnospiraceae bacterium]|nr:DNA-directed RNA polymerase subunit omega [Lachnospiraceae bacterium]MDY5742507.1 DNA-directed RNA polymerase subunit omega [Lachnospiraceae bacterium]